MDFSAITSPTSIVGGATLKTGFSYSGVAYNAVCVGANEVTAGTTVTDGYGAHITLSARGLDFFSSAAATWGALDTATGGVNSGCVKFSYMASNVATSII